MYAMSCTRPCGSADVAAVANTGEHREGAEPDRVTAHAQLRRVRLPNRCAPFEREHIRWGVCDEGGYMARDAENGRGARYYYSGDDGGGGRGWGEGASIYAVDVQFFGELSGRLSPKTSILFDSRTDSPRAALLLRLPPPDVASTPEVRCAVVGNVDSGKSTTLGVLTRGAPPQSTCNLLFRCKPVSPPFRPIR